MNKQMLYFAYGSNLNRQQMESKCPGSKYIKNYYRKGYGEQINQETRNKKNEWTSIKDKW